MHRSEIKTVQPASVFALLFSEVFIVGLVYLLASNLGLMPRDLGRLLQSLFSRLNRLTPVPRSLAYAALWGAAAGVVGMAASLVYNVFAGIVGGIKAEIEE